MRGNLKNIFLLVFALLLFFACAPDNLSVLNGDFQSEQQEEQGSRRIPYATTCLNDATRLITFYPGTLGLPKDVCYDGTCFYFLYADRIQKRIAYYPYTLISTYTTGPVQYLDYIDFAGNSYGLVGTSNSLHRIYTNLMEGTIYYMYYPSDLQQVNGLSCNMIDGTMFYFVTAILSNNNRYRIGYIYSSGQLLRYYLRNLTVAGTSNFDFDDYIYKDGYGIGYNSFIANFWKQPPSGLNNYAVEYFPNSYTAHGYISGYSGKLEYLFMDRIDYGYYRGQEMFIGLCYVNSNAAVELVYFPLSNLHFQ